MILSIFPQQKKIGELCGYFFLWGSHALNIGRFHKIPEFILVDYGGFGRCGILLNSSLTYCSSRE